MLTVVLFGLFCGITAYVIHGILTETGMILWPVYNLLINKWHIDERWPWLAKPLIDCPYCMAGQYALWGYVFLFDYQLTHHFVAVVMAIFGVEIIKKYI